METGTELTYDDKFNIVAKKIEEVFAGDEGMESDTATMLLFGYEHDQDTEGVLALYGFIKYVEQNPSDIRFSALGMRTMFAHDLNGAGGRGFLPRSSGYLKFGK